MDHIDSLISAKITSLQPTFGQDEENGPHAEEELEEIERRIGRSLDPDHRDMLEKMGGPFWFQFGPVDVGDTDLDVRGFIGAHPGQYNHIAELWHGARDRIPKSWYPFAEDFDGCLYCLTDQGAVHHIRLGELEEKRSEHITRPQLAGIRVADSFVQFVMSLRLPDWVVAHLRDSPGGTDGTP